MTRPIVTLLAASAALATLVSSAAPAMGANLAVPTPKVSIADVNSYLQGPRPVQLVGRRSLVKVTVGNLRPGARTSLTAKYQGGSTSCTPVTLDRSGRTGTGYCWIYNPAKPGRAALTITASHWRDGGLAQRRQTTVKTTKQVRAPRAGELTAAEVKRVTTCANTSKDVWLTFDDMGNARQVRSILATLRANNVKGRFFLIGSWTRSNPTLVREIVAAGHEVHNHTSTHPQLNKLSDGGVRNELRGGPAQTGANARGKMFRPPYAVQWDTTRIRNLSRAQGMSVCTWTVDTDDWNNASPAQMAYRVRVGDRITPRVEAGGVVLMHVNGDRTSSGGLQAVITAVKSRGLRLAPLR